LVVGLAAIYLATAERVYEASVDFVVTPLPAGEQRFEIGLLTASPDPSVGVQTATGLVTRRGVAERASPVLGGELTADDVLDAVTVTPVGTSDLVEVAASQPTPQGAADLANAFGRAAVEVQNAELRERISQALSQLQERAVVAERASLAEINEQIAWLESLPASGDPTIRLQTAAVPPEEPIRPRAVLTLAMGFLGGLTLAAALGLGLELTDTRLRREHQLRSAYSLPILARIPTSRRGSRDAQTRWDELSRPAQSGYRRLRSILAAAPRAQRPGRSILITGSAPIEDRAGVAVQLGNALALTGSEVILIATDWRQPILSGILDVHFEDEVESLSHAPAPLAARTLESKRLGSRLRLLLHESSESWTGPSVSANVDRRLDHLQARADFVIVTAPPPTEAADTLPLTGLVDRLILVVRLGSTTLRGGRELAEVFAVNGVRPTGFVVSGPGSQASPPRLS